MFGPIVIVCDALTEGAVAFGGAIAAVPSLGLMTINVAVSSISATATGIETAAVAVFGGIGTAIEALGGFLAFF